MGNAKRKGSFNGSFTIEDQKEEKGLGSVAIGGRGEEKRDPKGKN